MAESVAEKSAPIAAVSVAKAIDDDDSKSKTETKPDNDHATRERFAVLTAGGPLVIDVWLTMEGHPHRELFEERIKQVVSASDTDNDQKSTWRELAANQEFLKSENATNPNTPDARSKNWTERFDLNRDKRIQPAEAAAWLGRDAGRSAAALALRSRRSYHAIPALGSRVWQLVDSDNNRRLASEEIEGLPDKLLSLDANDDRIITTPELAPLREQLIDRGQQTPAARSHDARHAALHLRSPADADDLDYLLADLYAPRRNLGPNSFPALPRLFDQLDTDGDGSLYKEELAALLTMTPHLEMVVAFNRPQPEKRGQARLDVRKHESEISILAQPASNRIALALGKIRINLAADDLAIADVQYQSGERTEIRGMVHDESDALFETLDSNADGRLGEREITTSPAQMRALDANVDGQLTNDELPAAMIVAFLRSERSTEQSFYIPDAPAMTRSNDKSPTWFAQADFNGDGDVSRREFLGSLEQFSRLDANQNGFIAAEEASAATLSENERSTAVDH